MADTDNQQLPATDKQRQRFAERGEVVRSRDLSGAAVYVAGLIALVFSGKQLALHVLHFGHDAFGTLARDAANQGLWNLFFHGYAMAAMPLVGLCAAVALMAAVAQNRGVSLRPLSFDLGRINPLPKLGQLFGIRAAAGMLAWSWLKVSALLWVCGVVIYHKAPLLLSRQPSSLRAVFSLGADVLMAIAIRGAIVMVVLGVVDYIVAYVKLERKMRMSHEEVKEESKQETGDPRMRSRRRRRHVEMTRRLSVSAVPAADVVMVNPTHYAVALTYNATAMGAPKVVAKGMDAQAERIRSLARHHGVPVVAQPSLTRVLFKRVHVGRQIPADLFHAVAIVLAHVYRLRGKVA